MNTTRKKRVGQSLIKWRAIANINRGQGNLLCRDVKERLQQKTTDQHTNTDRLTWFYLYRTNCGGGSGGYPITWRNGRKTANKIKECKKEDVLSKGPHDEWPFSQQRPLPFPIFVGCFLFAVWHFLLLLFSYLTHSFNFILTLFSFSSGV